MRWFLRVLIALGLLIIVAVVGLYMGTSGSHVVLDTVATDPKLPAIEVDGVRLHAEAFGDPSRPVVIVLHGGPGNDYRMLESLQALADDFYVVFYDQRGAGLSARVPGAQLTVDGYVGELEGVRRHFAGDRAVHLVGHSWGAMLAAAYLTRHPSQVTSAVLAEPGFLDDAAMRAFMAASNGMRPELSSALIRQVVVSAFEALHVDGPDADARMDYFTMRLMSDPDIEGNPMAGYFCHRSMRNASLKMWRLGSTAMFSAQENVDADGHLKTPILGGQPYVGPVLFVASECNTLIGEPFQRVQMKHFPTARIEVVEGAGHTMFGERPEVTTALVRRFLTETSTTAR